MAKSQGCLIVRERGMEVEMERRGADKMVITNKVNRHVRNQMVFFGRSTFYGISGTQYIRKKIQRQIEAAHWGKKGYENFKKGKKIR